MCFRVPTLLKVIGLGWTSKGVSGGLRNGDKAGLCDALEFNVAAVVEEEVLWVARERVVVRWSVNPPPPPRGCCGCCCCCCCCLLPTEDNDESPPPPPPTPLPTVTLLASSCASSARNSLSMSASSTSLNTGKTKGTAGCWNRR